MKKTFPILPILDTMGMGTIDARDKTKAEAEKGRSRMQDLSDLFEEFDASAAEEDADALASGFFKWQPGVNHVRFMPGTHGIKAPWILAHQHMFKNPITDEWVSANCPRSSKGDHDRTCPLCEAVQSLLATGNPADRKLAEDMAVQSVGYARILDRNHPRRGVQIVRLSPGIVKRLIEFRTSQQYGVDFSHPLKGIDVFVKKEGSGLGTRYTVELSRQSPGPILEDGDEMRKLLENSKQIVLASYAAPTLAAEQQNMVPVVATHRAQSNASLPPPQTIDTTAKTSGGDDNDIPF